MSDQKEKKGKWSILALIEKTGNALPHPAVLFALFGLITLLLSWIGHLWGWSAVHPSTGEEIRTVNLLSHDGIHRILLEMVNNYTSFAPLGIVMVALLGIGIAESSGLMKAAINALILKAPKQLITFIIVFAGILSNVASDLGYILIVPLGGIIFHSLGRHPVAGMAAAFAGVSGGFSANLLIGTIDPLLAGLTTESARILDPDYYVLPTANYYFMAASSFVIAFIGTFVTKVWIEPRLGPYQGVVEPQPIEPLHPIEKKGLKRTFLVIIVFAVILAVGWIPDEGFLRGPDNTILHSPVLKGFIAVLFLFSATCGIVYGYTVGTFKKQGDIIEGVTTTFKSLVPFLVLVFFASQFVAWFRWSHLGILLAVHGASFLQQAHIGLIPLVMGFVVLSGFINLFMGSASAKWAVLGPVFVPMFMLLGYSPELSQAVYRIGDSVTNVISPMMSFFALMIVYFQKYDKNAGMGTIIATMLPYSLSFMLGWTFLMIVWIISGLPLGPDAGLYYQP